MKTYTIITKTETAWAPKYQYLYGLKFFGATIITNPTSDFIGCYKVKSSIGGTDGFIFKPSELASIVEET